MATKTSSKKTSAKKSAASSKRGNVKVTPNSVVFTLNATQKQQARKCLAETGRIRLGFKEVAVTKLGGITNGIVIIN